MPSELGNATNQYLEYLRVEQAETVVTATLAKAAVTATRLKRTTPGHGLVDQHVNEDAFMIAVQLHDYSGDLWVDDKRLDFPVSRKGNFTLYDFNRTWQADMKSAFDCVDFYIPRAALDALSDDLGGRPVETLRVDPGADVDDVSVRGLVWAMLPALERPHESSRLYLDHMALAITIHMAITYGEAAPLPPSHGAGLSRRQLRTATEMIDANLGGDIPLEMIARACELTPAYFARAFKASTGLPPHRWMLYRRIEKAKHLIRTTKLNIAEIGNVCGFPDRNHFVRAFFRLVGVSAGEWRRDW